ncbi:lipase 3-like [Coccinella septempunctata]|uniref:lipase 3-like n=1 Tax=Coccinella septempunctata TaxID=41139 RepID=UPI001D07A324|nr:lipase 3-like [Coccinella septempunctata]
MFAIIKGLLFFSVLSYKANGWEEIQYDKDGDLSLGEFILKYGSVPISTHELTLSDGYIIEVYRLESEDADTKKPFLLMHGLSGCSDSFFVDKKKSLPFFLMKQGYDVWLINNRGTIHSRRHTRLNSRTDKEYWQFSWQEIGLMDMPATIDLILANNKHEKVALLGHSEGSFEIFVGLSELPEYNKKIAISFHFGGAAYHSGCVPKMLNAGCRMRNLIQELLDRMGIAQLIPSNGIRETLISLCRLDTFSETCRQFMFDLLVVTNDSFSDFKDVSFIFTKWICGGSVREFLHFSQTGQSGIFARYDYGPRKNRKIYNSTLPPRFHLERVTSPTAIFCGMEDLFCRKENIDKARSEIPNVVFAKLIPHFGHVDFLLDRALQHHIYKDMIKLLRKYFK